MLGEKSNDEIESRFDEQYTIDNERNERDEATDLKKYANVKAQTINEQYYDEMKPVQ